jgi:hypothetical protein
VCWVHMPPPYEALCGILEAFPGLAVSLIAYRHVPHLR